MLGIDLGKNLCSLAGLDASGRVVLRRRLRRSSVEGFVGSLGQCTVAMEACCGAHHLGRVFAAHGHTVRLMSPEYVRPYVKAQKNDELDAEAIAEAATRPTMRFVEVKSQAQSDVQALHRARERLVAERTALINHLRALLLERGVAVPQGRRKLEEELAVFADEQSEAVSPRIRRLIEDLRSEWRALDERIAAFDAEFVRMAREDEAARYLRKNLIHGARAVLPYLVDRETPLGRWARGLLARTHKNVVIVALANKLARIAWAVLARGCTYEAGREAAAG